MYPVSCMHGAVPMGNFVRELFRSLLLRNELTNWIQRPQNQETTQFATIWYNSWLSGYITDFLDIRAHARPMQFVQYCFSGEKTFWKKRKNFLGSICVDKCCSAFSDDVTHSISIYMLFLKTWHLSPNALWLAPLRNICMHKVMIRFSFLWRQIKMTWVGRVRLRAAG